MHASVAAGVWWGLAFWLTYAAVEYFFYAILPLAPLPFAVFDPAHWRLNGLLLTCYSILGAVTGGASGFLIGRWRRLGPSTVSRLDADRSAGAVGLLAVLVVHLWISRPIPPSGYLTLLIALILCAVLFQSWRKPDSAIAGAVRFQPFFLALLLIMPTWLSVDILDGSGRPRKMLAYGCFLAAACVVNLLLSRVQPWSSRRHLAAALSVFAVAALSGVLLSRAHTISTAPLPPDARPDPGKPPVVLIVWDTARVDHTSLGGYSRDTTPNLTRFAQGATVFPRAVTTGNFTLTTHASMFTGLYPSWHGAGMPDKLSENRPLEAQVPTLAGTLFSKGYTTVAAAANSVFLAPEWGLTRGFQRFVVQRAVPPTRPRYRYRLREGLNRLIDLLLPGAGLDQRFRRGPEINAAVASSLARQEVRDRSFFLFVNYMDAHDPYSPPPPYDVRYLDGKARLPYARCLEIFRSGKASPDERERMIAQYDGGIAYADFAFGQLVDRLKAWGVFDRALIIATADHGESFGTHKVWTHSTSLYGSQTRVPLVIKYPGQNTPVTIDTPVSQVDLLPTVLETLGYAIPSNLQGRSLRHPEELKNRELLTEAFVGRALQIDSLKLIVGANGKRELYDTATDPAELHNLYSPLAPAAQLADTAFQRWMQAITRAAGTRQSTTDREELRRLKSLGYVQ